MDLDAFAWLLTDDGQQLLAEAVALGAAVRRRSARRARRPCAVRRRRPSRRSSPSPSPRPRCAGRRSRSSATWPPGCTSRPRGSSRPPGCPVARHRAARVQAFDAKSVVDLGCGIGGDLVALASAGLTTAGVDLDPERVAVAIGQPRRARARRRRPGRRRDDARPRAASTSRSPTRRGVRPRGRTFSTDQWSPPWSFVESLLARDACVKTAPGHPPRPGARRRRGRVGQRPRRGQGGRAVVGPAGDVRAPRHRDRRRRAGDADRGGRPGAPVSCPSGSSSTSRTARSSGPVWSPRSRPASTAGSIDEHLAYVTSDASFRTPFARGYQVLEELPYREKPLRAALRERNVGRLTIKKRGVDVVPEQLRKRLALSGDEEAVIVLTRVAGEGTCLLVRPFWSIPSWGVFGALGKLVSRRPWYRHRSLARLRGPGHRASRRR